MAELSKEVAERELMQLMTEWFASIKRQDGAWFERVMADDWSYVMIDGSVKDKIWYIQSLQQPFDTEPSGEVHEVTARVFGDIAIASGHYTVKGAHQGKDLSSHTRFTSVWRNREDRWEALAHHATRIAE